MSGNRTGPAAADTASGDVQHVQPSSEQSDDIGKGSKTKRGRDLFQQKRDRWFRAVISHPGLRKGAPSALWYIADHAGVRQDGYSWFSHATIAAGTAMSVTAVQRAIRSAEDCGLLLVVSHSSSRKPTHCYPILDGEPLAGELPNAVKHRAKVTDAKTHASGESDRCDAPHPSGSSAANIGQNSRQHRAKVTDDLLKDLSNDPSKHKRLTSSSTINHGARPTDDDDQDEEIRMLRDEPATRRKAEWVFTEFGLRPDTSSDVRSVARGVAILERRNSMDFDKEIMPAITAIARRRLGPRFLNCKWMQQYVAAEVMLRRDEAEDARR